VSRKKEEGSSKGELPILGALLSADRGGETPHAFSLQDLTRSTRRDGRNNRDYQEGRKGRTGIIERDLATPTGEDLGSDSAVSPITARRTSHVYPIPSDR